MRALFFSAAATVALLAIPVPLTAQDPLFVRLQELAASNNAQAIYHMGMAYHLGAGVTKDQGKAFAAFKKASELGDPLAAYKLGCFYAGQGEGIVAPDAEKAFAFKSVAAKAGYALAQLDIAGSYAAKGDLKESIHWVEQAAAQGWPDALYTLAALHNGYNGVAPDHVKAATYFRLYMRAGHESPPELAKLEATLSEDEKAKAARGAATYVPTPTALTRKGLSGQRAAEELVATTN